MTNFWPEGLSIKDIRSPYEILESAQQEWERKTEGVMTLILQRSEFGDGHAMIIVHAKHVPSNRTASLLSVIHRQNMSYPATIRPLEEQLPDFLRRENPGIIGELGKMQSGMIGGLGVKINKWVSETPSEFQENLAKAFNLSAVKTTILGLASEASLETPEDIDT